VQARADVARVELPGRLEQLRRATSLPGGTLLEKGRSLVEQRRHAEALVFMTAGGQAVLSDIVASLGSKPTDNRNPVIAELEFLDAARTRAAARIVGRSEGGTIILEKDRGEWVAREVVNKWIS